MKCSVTILFVEILRIICISVWLNNVTCTSQYNYWYEDNVPDRTKNQRERFSTTSSTANLNDEDDRNPSFIYQGCVTQDGVCVNPEYYATVTSGTVAGVLSILPEKIYAIDIDPTNAPISYSFQSGSPSTFRKFFEINSRTAVVKQIKPVDVLQTKRFDIIIQAEKQSTRRRSATAKLTINVKPVDNNPPVIHASASEGFADENAVVGTEVVDSFGKPIRITVTDADLGPNEPKPSYIFELTTTSFAITNDGILVINQRNLDGDSPSTRRYRFQILAREKNGNAASVPLTMIVTLNDMNDNAPVFSAVQPITIQAGENRRQIAQVEATDNDVGDNAIITYNIFHVSNNGYGKFAIDPKTGVLESVGKLSAGEQYSITVQATDGGGKSSQTIVEVSVEPKSNTKGPIFQYPVYEAFVSEGASVNTIVTSVQASDPDGRPVSYSIVTGNELREFGINPKTGVISVIRKLDREQLTEYQLIVKAEDEDGLSATTTVNIKISDINDKNPEFVNLPYEFTVEEGKDSAPVGQVKAVDADEGQNSIIRYSISEDVPFIVDTITGNIKTNAALDYERQSEYKFVVTAKDGATEPRLATATVTVKVIDVEDELPIFHVPLYEVKVPENVPDYIVAQVNADDSDTVQKVTYVIKQGPTDLFSINSSTGVIKTIKGLDHEKEVQHRLLIGTVENNSNKPGATTKVIVDVQDVNDTPPVFLIVPRPITLDDNIAIGTKVTNLLATDFDGTGPNNEVRYGIIGRGKAPKYFQIDPDLGIIQVRNDLRKELDNEYQIDVKAYDRGDPQLSSVVTVPIFVRRTSTTLPTETGIGFPESSYTIEISENSAVNALVKSFVVVSSKLSNEKFPLNCTITSGNTENIFYTTVSSDRNCELRIKEAKLDHEHEDQFTLKLRVDSLPGLVNVAKSTTTVNIQVTDLNDNKPIFIYPKTNERFAKQAYYGAISRDAAALSPVIQVKALDYDSDKFGQIEYRFVKDDSKTADYFLIDPISGMIKNTRGLEDISDTNLPFRLVVEARDNPAAPAIESNTAEAHVVINLIDDRHRLILVINDARPDTLKNEEDNIIDVLQEHSRLIIGIEKLMPRQYKLDDNVTVESDPNSTDVWFYAIDPDTELILERNSTKVTKSILEPDAVSNITLDVTGNIHATASGIHAPLTMRVIEIAGIGQHFQWNAWAFALVFVGLMILILSVVGIIYICVSWSRYKAYKDRMSRLHLTPRYDPVFVEPNLKEYETQVLQMSVPVDDNDSYNDLQLDFSRNRNHTFNLDNVGYIGKDNGNNGSTSSEDATTTRASSMSEHHTGGVTTHNGHVGRVNRGYERHSDEDMPSNFSPTNENVTFRERRDFHHPSTFSYLSPIETTTEL